MIAYFYEYIRKIILFLIFISFMQVILPSNKYKSYINLVFGMLLIFIMVQPITNIYNSIHSIKAFNIELETSNSIHVDTSQYIEVHNNMVGQLFQDNIKTQIQNIIGNKYIINDISIELVEDKYKYISVSQIYLDLSVFQSNIYVRKYNEEDTKNVEKEEINELKKSISNFYNIPMDNIFIDIT